VSRPYAGQSRDEWEGVTCPEDVCHERPERDPDAECDRLLQLAADERMAEVKAVMDIYHEVTHPARTRGLEMGTL